MCEPRGVQSYLKEVPFMVTSLAHVLPKGSHEQALAFAVAQAVRQNIDRAIERLDAGLKE